MKPLVTTTNVVFSHIKNLKIAGHITIVGRPSYDRTGQVMVLSSQSGHDFDLMILFGAPCFLDAIKVEKSLYFPCSLFHIFHFCQIYHFPYDKNFFNVVSGRKKAKNGLF